MKIFLYGLQAGLCLVCISASPLAVAQDSALKSSLYIGAYANGAEAVEFKELLDEAYYTVRSKNFAKNMEAQSKYFSKIFLSYHESDTNEPSKYTDAKTINQIMSGSGIYRHVVTPVALTGENDEYPANAGYIGDGVSGSFTLGRGHIFNWQSENIVRKSCAINTVSHEISHLISTDPKKFDIQSQIIQDLGAAKHSGSNAVASYLIGTIGQCTWLQNQDHIKANEVQMCVTVFGHRGFNGLRCSFYSNDEKVAIKPGLPAPHVLR